MQYRFKMQEKAVQPFIEYFRSSDRIVTVDVSSGAMEPIWDKVHEVFTAMNLVAWRPVESVLIFAMGKMNTWFNYNGTCEAGNIIYNLYNNIIKNFFSCHLFLNEGL